MGLASMLGPKKNWSMSGSGSARAFPRDPLSGSQRKKNAPMVDRPAVTRKPGEKSTWAKPGRPRSRTLTAASARTPSDQTIGLQKLAARGSMSWYVSTTSHHEDGPGDGFGDAQAKAARGSRKAAAESPAVRRFMGVPPDSRSERASES